jgi:hypothetical protein
VGRYAIARHGTLYTGMVKGISDDLGNPHQEKREEEAEGTEGGDG